MSIFIEKLQMNDLEILYKFEIENQAFFEKTVPSRGDAYYQFENFKEIYTCLLEEQVAKASYFYLIKNEHGDILGRINLTDINKSQKTGSLGYRIGRASSGKGIAQKALHLLIKQAKSLGVETIRAKTTDNNLASQKVLTNHNFEEIKINDETVELNGVTRTFVHYILVV